MLKENQHMVLLHDTRILCTRCMTQSVDEGEVVCTSCRTTQHFVNNNLPKPQKPSYNPLSDYEHLPVLILEAVVEKISHLVPGVAGYMSTAKTNCNRDSTLLTWDESAAIYLYTMAVPFYSTLNNTLRAGNRQMLNPWLAYLKLLMTALEKLPSTKATIWRGVDYDATLHFVDSNVYTWWGITSCSMNTNIVRTFLRESGTLFTIEAVHGKDVSMFSAVPDEAEVILMPGTRVRAKSEPFNFIDRLFVIHLEEIIPQSEPNHLYDQIKQEYQQNNRIECFINPAISFPIKQSYINLSIVETREQREKEEKLQNAKYATTVIGAYEDIYATKTAIDVKDIFKTCKDNKKQVLVFGRAGIGKSTFCRYIAYQWAIGSYWSQYELLALIPLRRLTDDRYPPTKEKKYSLIDLVRTELFPLDLNEKEEERLKKQFDVKKTLWILDGYDEIVQNVPPHLQSLLEQLLKTPQHIITSRPYFNTLSYNAQMEIIGFTDENIKNYIRNFFRQIDGELDDSLLKSEKLLNILQSNASIWGVAHIPVNLELICSLWSNADWSETKQLTMTRLYTMMTEWLCERYLIAQRAATQNISTSQTYQRCQKELAFLDSLAFHAMESNTILIRPVLLKKAFDEANLSSEDYSHILNIGILKSVDKHGIGTRRETDKDHYFVHLSFQEYFAARYLINALKRSQTGRSIAFIRHYKYNQRYTLLFSFMAGLLSDKDAESCLDHFWNTLLGPPVDLTGIRHMQLVIACMEETNGASILFQPSTLLEWIAECVKNSFITENKIVRNYLLQSLQRSQSIACDEAIINMLIDFLQHGDMKRKPEVLSFIRELKIANLSVALITTVISSLEDGDEKIRWNACHTLGEIGEKAATNEVISKLVSALEDQSEMVRWNACLALRKIGEKAATNEVISKLLSALDDQSKRVRESACEALVKIGEKEATNTVISKLVSALENESERVRENRCYAIGKIGEKAATNEVISKLLSALQDQSEGVRGYACRALGKIGEKAATTEVISKLVSALQDQSEGVRWNACLALREIGKKAATNEVISKLLSALEDQNEGVRGYACYVLGEIREKAAKTEVISKLLSALQDQSESVRIYAWQALGKIGEKAATNEVISKLLNALQDQSEGVRGYACRALGKIGEKAATNEVISKLVSALQDQSEWVRWNACLALGKIGEKRATNAVVSTLVSALEDKSEGVRENACEALGKIGEKVATNEVISKLLSALEDQSEGVRWNACEALGKIGEKVATNEVISKLFSALEDQSEWVRWSACLALGNIDGKAATNEVISKLVSALEDQSQTVRWNACDAVVKIGEKTATNEVISKLLSALEDQSERGRGYACLALGNIGEKAATNEVISKLVSAVHDQSEWVRRNACKALVKINEKAATNEVTSKLASALEDQSEEVRGYARQALWMIDENAERNEVISKLLSGLEDQSYSIREDACDALGKIGEKAATNEVSSKLVSLFNSGKLDVDQVAKIFRNSSRLPLVRKQLNPEVIVGLRLDYYAPYKLKIFSENDLINMFLETKNLGWISAVTRVAHVKGTAVTAIENKVVMYGKEEPVELLINDPQSVEELVKAFIDQGKRWHLYLEIPPKNFR